MTLWVESVVSEKPAVKPVTENLRFNIDVNDIPKTGKPVALGSALHSGSRLEFSLWK